MESGGKVRLGLVGAGRWGRIYIRALSGLPGLTLAAVASSNPATVTLLNPDTRLHPDASDMIKSGGLDGVIVATPPDSHVAIARMAVLAGLPVLVEKPLAYDAAEAAGLAALAAQRRVTVWVDHIHLFSPAFRRLKRIVADLGPVRAIRGCAGSHGPYRRDTSVLWDWGAHDVAMCLDLLGTMPDRMEARVVERRSLGNGDTGETVRLCLGFGPTSADITVGTLMDKTRLFEVECAGGTVVYDDVGPVRLTRDGDEEPVEADRPLDVVLSEFGAAVSGHSADLSSLALGIRVIQVLERCQAVLG
ncbi:Gfo/Idh/MocA family protein [Magnetospirillum sp. UT-4]|uniref:Gfo/Idh/MocA family protein n=1 Tax=Magnetospirillum sp. UT-4 TaxID=2681467 RepID=UPI0013807B29|nr:Gfo/Idh/MocA family oxidoreductase [Magnetospirillum sp. UT-4]CAA7621652.1 conserved hypothetical protein [Magnetospirillum sp. UT-4]